MAFGIMDRENGKLKGENGKVRGTPQSLCDSSPINKGAKRGDEIAAKAAVDGRSATPVDGRSRR